MSNIEKLKVLLGITDTSKDALLALIYEFAETSFLDYTNREEVPPAAIPTVLGLAVSRYNRIGTEGVNTASYSGISEHYANEFSEEETHSLNRWRKLKVL